MQIAISPKVQSLWHTFWLVVVVPITVVSIWGAVLFAAPWADGVAILLVLLVLHGIYINWRTRSVTDQSYSQREALLKLNESQADLNQLFDCSPVPYCKIDSNGTIVMANLAAVRLLDSTVEALPGTNLYGQVTAEEPGHWEMLQQKLNTGISIQDEEMQVRSLRGREYWVLLSVFVNSIGSKDRLVTLVDVTQQKQIDQAKSEFVALASHQLRTPLAAIRFNTELILSSITGITEKQQTYINKIERNTANMISLINDFLSVSQLETGTYTADLATFTFDEYIGEVLEEYTGMQTQKQLSVPTSFTPVGISVTADRRLLHIVVSNLISNAMKYTPANGTVAVGYTLSDNKIVFTVQDTGMGIPANELPNLFTKFFRASNAKAERAEGTGLGLYIVAQATEQMGGSINVASEEGKGSTFTATIPLSQG